MDENHPPHPPADDPEMSLGGGATPDVNELAATPPSDDVATRLADLERELARTRAERDEYKASMYSLLGQVIPFVPPTAEEIHDMMYGPRGQPIGEIIEELEREMEANK